MGTMENLILCYRLNYFYSGQSQEKNLVHEFEQVSVDDWFLKSTWPHPKISEYQKFQH